MTGRSVRVGEVPETVAGQLKGRSDYAAAALTPRPPEVVSAPRPDCRVGACNNGLTIVFLCGDGAEWSKQRRSYRRTRRRRTCRCNRRGPASGASPAPTACPRACHTRRRHSSPIRWGCRRARRCAWCRVAPVVLVLEHEDPYSVAAGSSSGGRPAASPVSTGRREGRSFWLVIFMKCPLVLEGVSSSREYTDERSQHLWHWPPVATTCPSFGQRLTNGRWAVNTTRPGQVR